MGHITVTDQFYRPMPESPEWNVNEWMINAVTDHKNAVTKHKISFPFPFSEQLKPMALAVPS